MNSEICSFKNKKMAKFNERKKRYLIKNNIIGTEAVDRFCNLLIGIINTKFKNGKHGSLTWSEKFHYIEKFCEKRLLHNKDVRKICDEKLTETYVQNKEYHERQL